MGLAEHVQALPGVVGLPQLAPAAEPQVGMTVVKVGYATALSEGMIVRIDGADIQIEGADGAAASAAGDSGAVWVAKQSWSPVALHTGVNSLGTIPYACGMNIVRVLDALKLELLMS